MKRSVRYFFVVLVLKLSVFYIPNSFATNNQPSNVTQIYSPFSVQTAQGEKRIALVIGNADYDGENLQKLKNPVNDAVAIKDKLLTLGFEVYLGTNLTYSKFGEFSQQYFNRVSRIEGDKVVSLFYYAGHGMGISGRNFLFPTNAILTKAEYAEFQGFKVLDVATKMKAAGAKLNLLIIDACRNNTFGPAYRGNINASLVSSNQALPEGVQIEYSTRYMQVAADNPERNHSVFTENLLRYIDEPGLSYTNLFRKVAKAVLTETGGNQEPWAEGRILSEYYLINPQNNIAMSRSAQENTNNNVQKVTRPTGPIKSQVGDTRVVPRHSYWMKAKAEVSTKGELIAEITTESKELMAGFRGQAVFYLKNDNQIITTVKSPFYGVNGEAIISAPSSRNDIFKVKLEPEIIEQLSAIEIKFVTS